MQKQLVLSCIVTLLIGAGAFYSGMQYEHAHQPTQNVSQRGNSGRGGPSDRGRGGANGGFVSGEVLKKDGQSLTLTLRDGGSKIVFFASSTTVGKMAPGVIDDVGERAQVMVSGTQNSDGSMTATNIQIRPPGMQRSPRGPEGELGKNP